MTETEREAWKDATFHEYLDNNMQKLRKVAWSQCGRFLQNGTVNQDDYMSVANMTFWRAVETYNEERNDSFQAFLTVCLHNKINSEFLRIQNCAAVSVSTQTVPIESSTQEEIGLDEILPADDLTENCIDEYNLRDDVYDYVHSFFGLYRNILDLIMEGYTEDEIQAKLNLSRRQYADCMTKLRSRKHTALVNK